MLSKTYILILTFVLAYAVKAQENNDVIRIKKQVTCIEPAVDLMSHMITERVLYKARDHYKVKIYDFKLNKENYYYAHLNLDSSITHRKIKWKFQQERKHTESYNYVYISYEDFHQYRIYKKTSARYCEECKNDERIIYLENRITEDIKVDKLVLSNATYRKSPFSKYKYIINIPAEFIDNNAEYYDNNYNKIETFDKRFFNKNQLKIRVNLYNPERKNAITEREPLILKKQVICSNLVDSNSNLQPLLINIEEEPELEFRGSQYLGFGLNYSSLTSSAIFDLAYNYHSQYNSIRSSLGIGLNKRFYAQLKTQHNLYNYTANRTLLKRKYENIRTRFNSVYLGQNLDYGFIERSNSLAQAIYLGFSSRTLYYDKIISLFTDLGFYNNYNNAFKLKPFFRFGIEFNLVSL